MAARAFLLLACACVARAYNGYAISLEGLNQMFSLASPPLDMSNAETAQMAQGLTVSAWVRFRDVTPGLSIGEFTILLNDDEYFWRGLYALH
jgi:hypothetical protein